MSDVPDSFYAQWRVRCGVAPILREDTESPSERLLQNIWQHQRLRRDELKTFDGQPVRILHPGFHNLEGGPDFRDAVVQLGDEPACTGDIEVDLRPGGWHAHGHDRNPAFRQVLLHVLWECERPLPGAPPALVLRPVLDAPLGELSLWLGGESARAFPADLRGRCCAPLTGLSAKALVELLHEAARVRLRSKAAQFQARARQVGWEQSLWEGLFRALGYKHNGWPMQRLAELRPRWARAKEAAARQGVDAPAGPAAVAGKGVFDVQSRLLGLSGLLPTELTRKAGTDAYLRRVWDQWWRERDEFSDAILPRAVWHLHGLRPANHPQRRLALAAAWSADAELGPKLERWCAREYAKKELVGSLWEVLRVGPDEFWSWHWTLRSGRLKREQPLLGATRVTDLAVNVVLPWLWSRAREGQSQGVQGRLEERYFGWPPAQDNSVLRLARERLLGGAAGKALPGAAAQQGLLQVVRDFCEHSNAVCDACQLPDLLAEGVREGFLNRKGEQRERS